MRFLLSPLVIGIMTAFFVGLNRAFALRDRLITQALRDEVKALRAVLDNRPALDDSVPAAAEPEPLP